METQETIRDRRTVHEYTDQDVTDEDLRQIFDVVRWAPSSYNLQPWEFLVCRDEERKEVLRDCAFDQPQVTEADAVVVVFGDRDRSAHAERVFRDQAEKGYTSDGRAEDLIEQMAEEDPMENDEWVVQSCMIAATTLLYTAWDLGIASCPMGGWDGSAIRDAFDVPETWYPVLMITLGGADHDGEEMGRPRKFRRDPSTFVHHETIDG